MYSKTYKNGWARKIWDDDRIRQECLAGACREMMAYLNAGYTLQPKERPVLEKEELERKLVNQFRDIQVKDRLIRCRDVAALVIAKHNITISQLKGQCRSKHLVIARQEFIDICVNILGKSCASVGRFLGRDHTTVCYHAHKMAAKRRDQKCSEQPAQAVNQPLSP